METDDNSERKFELKIRTNELSEINKMIEDTIRKRIDIKEEFEESKKKFKKEMLNLRTIEEYQEKKLNDLECEIRVLSGRTIECKDIEAENLELTEELMELQKVSNTKEEIDRLENEIKEAFLLWESIDESSMIVSVGKDLVRENSKSFLTEASAEMRDKVIQKQAKINAEMSKIDEQIKKCEDELHFYKERCKNLLEIEKKLENSMGNVNDKTETIYEKNYLKADDDSNSY